MRERMVGNEIRDVGRGWTVLSHEKDWDRSCGNVLSREQMVSTPDFEAVTPAEYTKQRGSRNSPGRTQGS